MSSKRVAVSELSAAKSYRELLLVVLRSGAATLPRGSIASLARRSGLSRGFLTEVLQHKKGLTTRSLARVVLALRLHGDTKRLLEYLVAREVESVREELFMCSVPELERKIELLRRRMLKSSEYGEHAKPRSKAPLVRDAFIVYAALGSPSLGASFSEILKRTNLDPSKVQRALESMLEASWLRHEGDRYFAIEPSMDLQGLSVDETFVRAFAEACLELARRSAEVAKAEGTLTFYSAIPVNASRVQELKDRLRAGILEILDEFQDDHGSVIRQITVGMY